MVSEKGLLAELSYLANITVKLLDLRKTEFEILREDFVKEVRELIARGYEVSYRGKRMIEARSEKDQTIVIKKKIIHGPKLEPIYGADVAIEKPGRWTVFIQYKKVGKKKRFSIGRGQLLTLIRLCQLLCEPRCVALRIGPWCWPCLIPPRIACGSTYYALAFEDGIRYIRACDLSFVLGQRASISANEIRPATMPEEEFKRLVMKQRIGCADLPAEQKEKIFKMYCILTNRLVIFLEIE